MQHSVLDTLVYLFDFLVCEKKSHPTTEEMNEELGAAGFAQKDIDRAMEWLSDLSDLQNHQLLTMPSSQSVRQFTQLEMQKISPESRAFLHHLMKIGVIDVHLREVLIQKLMVLDEDNISVDEIKWVTLMAVFNRPGQEANTVWLEQSLLGETMVVQNN